MKEIKLYTEEKLQSMTNQELLDYKVEMELHGEYIEDYVNVLKTHHRDLLTELRDRHWQLSYELECIKQEQEDTWGSGEHPDTYLN